MTFEGYWAEVGKLDVLPGMAVQQLPETLSSGIKKKLMEMKPEETAKMLEEAIYQINHGSVESIEALLRKKL